MLERGWFRKARRRRGEAIKDEAGDARVVVFGKVNEFVAVGAGAEPSGAGTPQSSHRDLVWDVRKMVSASLKKKKKLKIRVICQGCSELKPSTEKEGGGFSLKMKKYRDEGRPPDWDSSAAGVSGGSCWRVGGPRCLPKTNHEPEVPGAVPRR